MPLLLMNIAVLVLLAMLLVVLFPIVKLQREFMTEWRRWGLLESHRITVLEERIKQLEAKEKEPDGR